MSQHFLFESIRYCHCCLLEICDPRQSRRTYSPPAGQISLVVMGNHFGSQVPVEGLDAALPSTIFVFDFEYSARQSGSRFLEADK